MTTSTLTLVRFLLARITEDEVVARVATPGPWRMEPVVYGRPEDGWGDPSDGEVVTADGAFWVVSHQMYEGGGASLIDAAHIARHDPARVLANCERDRRIMEAHHAERLTEPDDDDEVWTDCRDCWQAPPCLTLRLLALPYADHPDYDEGWRP